MIDISGNVYGRLTVIHKVKAKSTASSYWLCRCICGKEKTVSSAKLRNGLTLSCGCYRASLKNNLIHGMANKTPTYRTWKEMRQRCLNPRSDKARWYSGRGIKICDRWLQSFEAFLEDMGERPVGKTLDRKDVNGNYEPSNCRWATPRQQAESNRGCFRRGNAPHNKGTSK
ncbi:MAG: hypothetical protein EBZ49_14425 [Proteobacteria bacterium]|nr:hypothetical protein [Pseudomonadota bacterium]